MKTLSARIVMAGRSDRPKRYREDDNLGRGFANAVRCRAPLLLCAVLLGMIATSAFSQSSPADGPWSGSMQCQVNIDLNDYSRHETQTWTLTGKKLAPNGQMRIYEAAWTVTGQGQFLAPGAQGQAVLTKWTMNVPASSAALSFFMSPNQLVLRFQNWSQTRADNAITATQQLVQNGVVQPQAQPKPPGSIREWNFGLINEGITSDTLSGTKSILVGSLGAGMQRYGVPNEPATCNWQFTKGSTPSNTQNPSQNCSQAADNITKYFDAMETDVAKQFEALIQQTTDPNQAASLKNQEKSTISQLEQLKQQNLNAASSNCDTQMANTLPGGGTANPNSGQPPGGMGQGSGGIPNQNPPGSSNPSMGGTTDPNTQRSPAPQLIKVEPASAQQNTTTMQVALTGQGTHWLQGTTKLDFGPGITIQGQPAFPTATDAHVAIAVAPDAAVGPRTVTATSPFQGKTETVALPDAFAVTERFTKQAPGVNIPINTGLNPPSGTTPAINYTAVKKSLPTKNPAASTSPGSGNYLVTITGLRCGRAILDDPLDRDGKGDEIYAAAYVRRYDRRTGEFLEQSTHQTVEYGDNRNFPGREQAGSLSPTGGIGDLDSIPPNASADRCCPPQDSRFPLKLWQGSLTDGADVLIISPSVWESDGDPSWLYVWGQAQNQLGESLLSRQEVQDQINRKLFGPITVGATAANSGNLTQAGAGVIVGALGVPLVGLPVQALTGGFKDRPIGLVPNGVDATVLPNTTIILTREIIEAALSSSHQAVVSPAQGVNVVTPKPGIMVFNFMDTFRPNDWSSLGLGLGINDVSPGLFTMVLQVERQ